MLGLLRLAQLSRAQWRSTEELKRRQLVALRDIVRHAYSTVPFYRDLFDRHAVKPQDLNTLDDYLSFPVVTRQALQAAGRSDLVTQGIDPDTCLRSRTSGSTGRPMELLFLKRDRAAFNPSFLRVYIAWGLRPWHRYATFQARRERLGQRSWYQYLGIFRSRVLFSQDDPERWISSLRRWRPRMIHGYSLTLKLLAEALEGAGISDLRVPLVTSTSGVLDDDARQLLTKTLGAKVVDIYASDEAGSVIAWECPRCSGYHLCDDTVLTEFLVDGRPARAGEDASVIITNLMNRTMPLLRYQQGDIARVSDTVPFCGRGLPLMESVRGRMGDFILLPSGRKLSPHSFFLVLDHALGVGRWQISQDSANRISVQVTMPDGHTTDDLDSIRSAIRKLVDNEVVVNVGVVDSIERAPGQKLRSVVSALSEAQVTG